MKLNINLNKDGYLTEPLSEEDYKFSTTKLVEYDEKMALVTYRVTTYYLGSVRDFPPFAYREEVSRVEYEEKSYEDLVLDKKALVDKVEALKIKALPLVKHLPLKNATQREYALQVALTNLEFAKEFDSIPDAFKDIIIQ